MTTSAQPLGVSLVSGFLGSGKTTFINRLLSSDHGVRMGVVVNDFGDINIDSKLVVSRTEDTVTLENGCICCTLRDDLGVALTQLITQNVEHVVVEASGISDPRVLTRTFMVLDQGKRVRLDAVVVLVDCEQISTYGPADLSLARDQLSQANVALLNKTDLADEQAMAAALHEVHRFCPRAAIVECVQADVPTELVLGVGRFDPAQLQQVSAVVAGHGFRTHGFVCDDPLSLARLKDAATELPANVFRAKGIVFLRERPEHRCILQVVGRRARIDIDRPWGDDIPRTELVFLGRGNLDPTELDRMFEACTAPPSTPSVMTRAVAWLRQRLPGS